MVIRHHDTDLPPPHTMQEAIRLSKGTPSPKPPWLPSTWTPPQATLPSTTQRAIQIYLLSRLPNGEMGGIGWWQSANGYTAMALHDLWSYSTTTTTTNNNFSTLDTAIRRCEARQTGLINVFNDDTLWWGLLCLHMYSLSNRKEEWYLRVAKGIWQHVRASGSVCGRGEVLWRGRDMEGAVYWTTKKGEEQVNSISTALFAELSVRLALIAKEKQAGHSGDLTGVEEYVEAARCSLGWILRCRYRSHEGVVLDHIKLQQDKCIDWTFTYTTGVTLGVCALLYQATGEDDYMHLACHMANKAMRRSGWVEADGVLTEKGAYGRGTHDPWKNNDAVGFKSVLLRHLCSLFDVILSSRCDVPGAKETAETIKAFVNINFRSQVERNSNDKGQYGPWWDGPFECPTSHAQMAVLDVMAAVRLVNRS